MAASNIPLYSEFLLTEEEEKKLLLEQNGSGQAPDEKPILDCWTPSERQVLSNFFALIPRSDCNEEVVPEKQSFSEARPPKREDSITTLFSNLGPFNADARSSTQSGECLDALYVPPPKINLSEMLRSDKHDRPDIQKVVSKGMACCEYCDETLKLVFCNSANFLRTLDMVKDIDNHERRCFKVMNPLLTYLCHLVTSQTLPKFLKFCTECSWLPVLNDETFEFVHYNYFQGMLTSEELERVRKLVQKE